jgi:nitrate reductase / nitrite oxidoreductase, alpha subunit
MSMVSYTAGTRFLSLIGGVCLSFYDWYADLPPASPQTWGDQTDVPESADWWNSSYMILWGSNIPQTRTPDAHFMTEARYHGTKVVVVSPDYAGHTKFADHWLPAVAGTDGALAMAMGHVMLREFYVDRRVPYFEDYARRFTDLPFLVTLREREDGTLVPDAFLRAGQVGESGEHADWRTVVRRAQRRARDPQRFDRRPLGRGGGRTLEPRARRADACTEHARESRRAYGGAPAAL